MDWAVLLPSGSLQLPEKSTVHLVQFIRDVPFMVRVRVTFPDLPFDSCTQTLAEPSLVFKDTPRLSTQKVNNLILKEKKGQRASLVAE